VQRASQAQGFSGRWLILAVVCLVTFVVIVLASAIFESSYDGPLEAAAQAVTRWRIDHRAAQGEESRRPRRDVMVDGQVEAACGPGERKKGSGVPLEISDRWHLGGSPRVSRQR